MSLQWQNGLIFGRAAWRSLVTLPPLLVGAEADLERPFEVSPDFFGICVASAPDPACDDYILARLADLRLRCMRLDFSYADRGAFGERFLKRLLAEKFKVALHLVQPRDEAAAIENAGAKSRWRDFVAGLLDAYGAQIELVEIGSTCNRRKWSGYAPAGFLAAWQIAWEEARRRKVTLAGPNITDFEPFYNLLYLGEMRRRGLLPDIHTDNLFVERATEPEAFDHKIAGRRLASMLRFNLVKKARVLAVISRRAGVPRLMCAHVSWSLRRVARVLDLTEEKQADYLSRYCILAAASGAFSRVYWGPLIGQREGLIDDGTAEFPDLPHVTYYGRANGNIADYRPRLAFDAFQTVNRFIAGAVFRRRIPSGRGMERIEFGLAGRRLHAAWTTNGNRALARDCYPSAVLAAAQAFSRDGKKLERVPIMFSESPLFLIWPDGPADSPAPSGINERLAMPPGGSAVSGGRESAGTKPPAKAISGVRFANLPGQAFDRLEPSISPPWQGAFLAEAGGAKIGAPDILALIGAPPPAARLLRDSRNRVWSLPAPWDPHQAVIVKCFRKPGLPRKILDCCKPGRALRSWNGAQELLRRGLGTPLPLAFVQSARQPRTGASYYICREFECSFSAREAFASLAGGAPAFQGFSPDALFADMARFVLSMHDRGVFFRDLSAGNLRLRPAAGPGLEFALIDTARARFYPRPLGLRQRLCDLMRLCHPLDQPGRDQLVGKYLELMDCPRRWWMNIPFAYYDWKHRAKRALK